MTSLGRDPERDKWQKHKPTQGTFITLRMGLRIGSYQILRGEKKYTYVCRIPLVITKQKNQ